MLSEEEMPEISEISTESTAKKSSESIQVNVIESIPPPKSIRFDVIELLDALMF